MASFGMSSQHWINDTLVEPGALISTPISTTPVLGRLIKAGARCESLRPDRWTAVVCADATIVWEGEHFSSYDEAARSAQEHARKSLDLALQEFFRD